MFTINHSFAPTINLDAEFLDTYEPLFDAAMKCCITTIRPTGPGIEIEVDYNTNTITSFSLNEDFKQFFLENEEQVIRCVLMHQLWLKLKGRMTTEKEYQAMLRHGWPERWIEENKVFLEQFFD